MMRTLVRAMSPGLYSTSDALDGTSLPTTADP